MNKINDPLKKTVGKVSVEEKNEIQLLHERKNGLIELIKSLVNLDQNVLENSYLYEKLVKDMGITTTKHQQWWNDKSSKYSWESKEGCSWEINFETCEIYLVNK